VEEFVSLGRGASVVASVRIAEYALEDCKPWKAIMTVASERPQALRRLPLFEKVDDASMRQVLMCIRFRVLNRGDTLYKEGEAGDSMGIVLEGTLVAKSKLKRGGDFELERTSVGGLVGEMVCVDPAPRSATVTAMQQSVIAELNRDGLMALRAGAPKVYALLMRNIIAVVSRRLRAVDDRIDAELGPVGAPPKQKAAPKRQADEKPASTDGFAGFLDRLLGR
jgi:CRP-like cAMP-binding protein